MDKQELKQVTIYILYTNNIKMCLPNESLMCLCFAHSSHPDYYAIQDFIISCLKVFNKAHFFHGLCSQTLSFWPPCDCAMQVNHFYLFHLNPQVRLPVLIFICSLWFRDKCKFVPLLLFFCSRSLVCVVYAAYLIFGTFAKQHWAL